MFQTHGWSRRTQWVSLQVHAVFLGLPRGDRSPPGRRRVLYAEVHTNRLRAETHPHSAGPAGPPRAVAPALSSGGTGTLSCVTCLTLPLHGNHRCPKQHPCGGGSLPTRPTYQVYGRFSL